MMKHIAGACSIPLALAAAAPAQTPAGGEFRINTYTLGRQGGARLAMQPGADFVVVWESPNQDGSSYGIFGQRFAASGTPRGGEFQINVYTTGYQIEPAVAVGGNGGFIVVWRARYGLDTDIRGRLFDRFGTAIGDEFLVNDYTTYDQTVPAVGQAADGRFVVSWTSANVDGSYLGVAARRFDASANPLGSEFVVNTSTVGTQFLSALAVHPSGAFVVVWEDFTVRDGSSSAIFGQRFGASGNRLGSEFRVNSYTTGAQRFASVSMSPARDFTVAWSSEGDGSLSGVFARRFDASGSAVGEDFVVNTYTTGYQIVRFATSTVAHDARGNFVVAWENIPYVGGVADTVAQRFLATGVRRGTEFRVNTYTTGEQGRGSVVSDAVGNFGVVWHSLGQDGSGAGVFAQRFGGLVPAALDVDDAGNQVLEPGETAEVKPTWRNFNGADQHFIGGALTGITGPEGSRPAYTITDPTGHYGTIANGSTTTCSDCYAGLVSSQVPRPATHWDVSVVESIVPQTQGQQKEWVLHVGGSFTDVLTWSAFYRFVETLLHRGVTGGCSPTEFCPGVSTTREQMAVLVLVGKEGTGYVPPACTTPMFADVPASSPFCRWIEELARRAVVGGCGGGKYCPSSAVTREQMAVFVLRALDPAPAPPLCTTPIYGDVPASNAFCPWIEELTRRGVVSGCGGGNYCPTAPVTREQMSVFISATFGLTLYGP